MYRIETCVTDKILNSQYVNGDSNYTIENLDILENGGYYSQGFTEYGRSGVYCDDHLYVYGILSDERIICSSSIGENISKPDFTVEVIFDGIGKDRSERRIFLREQSHKSINAYKIHSDEDFQLVFDIIRPRYCRLPKYFDDEYNRLMNLLIPQLQACREYLMLIGKSKNKATDFKKQ